MFVHTVGKILIYINYTKEACHCNNVTYGMIEDAIKNGEQTLEEVRNVTGAAEGCGKCKVFCSV